MGKKAALPPGASGKSNSTKAARATRRNMLNTARRWSSAALVALLAWAAVAAWPKVKLYVKRARRANSRAEKATAKGVEWSVHQARGDTLVARGQAAAAVESYREAIKVSPKLSPSHTNLCHALLMLGKAAEAVEECTTGYELAADGKEAAAALVNYGAAHHRGLGPAGVATAAGAWRRAADLDPTSTSARAYLARAGLATGALREAAVAERENYALEPRPEGLLRLARLATATNRTGDVVGMDLLESAFGDADGLDGFQDEVDARFAEEDLPPAHGAALKQASFLHAHATGHHDFAWESLVAANALRRRASAAENVQKGGADLSLSAAEALIEAFPGVEAARRRRAAQAEVDAALLAEVAGEEAAEAVRRDDARAKKTLDDEETALPRLLMIVGAPRTGGTLLHAVLGDHANVATDGREAPSLGRFVSSAGLAFFRSAEDGELASLGRRYRETVMGRNQLTANHSYVVDADRENVWWLGAASLSLGPGTYKAIIVRRDPRATAWSCLKSDLGDGREWADDYADLGARLRAIRSLEDHWLRTLPADTVRLVEYEALVADPAAVAADVFAWLGLEPCAACLRPDASPTYFVGPGALELRAPAFHNASLRAWRVYEKFLAETVFPHLEAT